MPTPHIHVPKGPHSWRDALVDIAIIGVGVMIALTAEQLLLRWEWKHKVETAEKAMRRELLWDNGPQIYYRAAAHPCAVDRLDAIRAAVEEGRSRQEISDLIGRYWVQFDTYDSLAREDATASNVAAHMDPDELDDFTLAYAVMPRMNEIASREAADLARLRALRRTGGPLSEYEASEVLAGVEALRNDDHQMWDSARWALPAIKRLGQLDQGRVMHAMSKLREHYGDCVQDLSSDWPGSIENLKD
jgi:hypothetical protein